MVFSEGGMGCRAEGSLEDTYVVSTVRSEGIEMPPLKILLFHFHVNCDSRSEKFESSL